MRQLKQVNKIQNVLKYRNPLLLSFSVTTEEKNYNDSIIQLLITYTMEPSRTAAQEVVLSKKSIVLYPAGEGNAKVVLVKHYISPSGRKHKNLKPAFTDTEGYSAPRRACKRRSLELVDSKENKEQYPAVKRRRSVQLGDLKRTVENLSLLHQETGKSQHPCLVCNNNFLPCRHDQVRTNSYDTQSQHGHSEQNCQPLTDKLLSKIFENERLNFQRDDQQSQGLWNNSYDQGIVLLPENCVDKRNKADLLEIHMERQLDKHKSVFCTPQQETPQVKSNGKCKSLFATYHLNKIHKSVVDEI